MMGKFHAHSGWYFERLEDGSVRLSAMGATELMSATFNADTWASAVASVSADGETAETFRAALEFHG
jgi:fructoselysine-6-P-deglycase FrlB-like protein